MEVVQEFCDKYSLRIDKQSLKYSLEVRLTGSAVSGGFVDATHRMSSLPRDGKVDPVVRNTGRDCPTWVALY